MNKFRIIIFILFLVLLTSCQAQSVTEAPEIPLIPTQLNRVLINEVLAGAEDNNQADFIELYNANSEITDLNGYSLWYQLKDGSEEIL